jgi:hypothetical protein
MSPASSADDDPRWPATGEGRSPGTGGLIAGEADEARPTGATHGRAHFQEQLRALEANALGGLDLIVEQLDRVL